MGGRGADICLLVGAGNEGFPRLASNPEGLPRLTLNLGLSLLEEVPGGLPLFFFDFPAILN